ncbi:MAG: YdcF family protein [Clostridia bacterium]|nr:YdcF family protein [Clostridia bacterium]
MKTRKKTIKRIILICFALAAAGIAFVVISNLIIIAGTRGNIIADDDFSAFDADCILILGAGVWNGDTPSPMLADRLDEGLRLYNEGAAPKIIVSGDHGRKDYDEVNVMKKYLINAGVPSEDIFMDHAGFSTYESMYRARDIFGVGSLIVVTQRYHLYRSLYICDRLGLDAVGSPADPRRYAGEAYRQARELLARDKDIFSCLLKVKPTYLGDKIDITGSGDVTND